MHSILQRLEENEWKSSEEQIDSIATFHNISIKNLLSTRDRLHKVRFEEISQFFCHWEWRNLHFQSIQDIPSNESEWRKDTCDLSKNEKEESTSEYSFISKCVEKPSLSWRKQVYLPKCSKKLSFNNYSWVGQCMQFFLKSKSPLIVATDGSHLTQPNLESLAKTTSGFVLCALDIKNDESISSEEWIERPVIPILSRVMILPTNFGTCDSDIAYGEFCALLMAEIAFRNLPRITISDSKAIREQAIKVRDNDSENTDRNYIRSIAGGVGKFVTGLMKDILHQSKISEDFSKSGDPIANKLINIFKHRNTIFLNTASKWKTPLPHVGNHNDLLGWEESYFEAHVNKPILKVNSHQLNSSGTRIKEPPRYKTLIPNLAMLSANHFADMCANHGRHFFHKSYSLDHPPPFLRFFIT